MSYLKQFALQSFTIAHFINYIIINYILLLNLKTYLFGEFELIKCSVKGPKVTGIRVSKSNQVALAWAKTCQELPETTVLLSW